jgi:hypothetical protein
VTISTPGQNAELTFSGTADDRVSLQLSNVTMSGRTVSILKPDGSTLAVLTGINTFLDTQTLPTTGTYTIRVDPTNAATGSATLTGVPRI